jgi:hypothetical protein
MSLRAEVPAWLRAVHPSFGITPGERRYRILASTSTICLPNGCMRAIHYER